VQQEQLLYAAGVLGSKQLMLLQMRNVPEALTDCLCLYLCNSGHNHGG
jgi:hypothetical protein